MAKFGVIFFPVCGSAFTFPDVLVPVDGQPKMPDTQWQLRENEIPANSANTSVVSLGWGGLLPEKLLTSGGMCLDVGGGASVNGAPVQMWSCLGNANQIWTSDLFPSSQVLPAKNSSLFFAGDNESPSHCLDVPNGNIEEGQVVWLWECIKDSPTQDWQWSSAAIWEYSGQLSLHEYPDWCLERSDSEGGYPFLASCSDSEAQVWSNSLPMLV